MDVNSAQKSVTAVSVLYYIMAAAYALLAILAVVGASFLTGILGMLIGILGMVFAVVFTLFALVSALIGYGVQIRKNWARIVVLILSWMGVVFGALGIIASLLGGDMSGILYTLITTGISAAIVWLFQFQPDAVALFKAPISTATT